MKPLETNVWIQNLNPTVRFLSHHIKVKQIHCSVKIDALFILAF